MDFARVSCGSPFLVFPAHPSDKVTQAPVDPWPSCCRPDFQRRNALTPAHATSESSLVEPPGPHRVDSARAESSPPATPGHCREVEDAAGARFKAMLS